MFTQSAELYDLIYSSFKDYPKEARDIADLLRRINPACHTVLDVACGTGEHARLLAANHGLEVDGIDLDPAFVRIARAKHPAGRFYQGDMVNFRLDRRYDAVLCLFSSIGYLMTLDAVRRALGCFRQHLAPHGVVIVEPWLEPGVLEPGRTETRTAEAGDLRVERVSRVEVEGRVSRLHFDYEIHQPSGVRHATEVHQLGLFTTAEMLETFRAADFVAEHQTPGPTGRGLFIARPVA